MPKLNWRVRTKKRGSSTQGVPPGEEDLAWVIRDFSFVAASTSTAVDLYSKVLALYPNRVNPGSLWASAKAVKGTAQASVGKTE